MTIKVARELSKLHAFCLPETDAEAKQTLNENHAIISAFRAEKFAAELAGNLNAFTTEYAKFFTKPDKLPEQVSNTSDNVCKFLVSLMVFAK